MYKILIRPILDRLDSETWHNNVKKFMSLSESSSSTLRLLEYVANFGSRVEDRRLNVDLAGIKLENPLLVGAGWDKTGKSVKALHSIGFAGVEVGSVLSRPQLGNPKPRQFMLNPEVCLNSLGFNSPGMEAVSQNLRKYEKSNVPIGISLGINRNVEPKDAPASHAIVAEKLFNFAAYFAINVSSPNTPGLRKLQEKEELLDIILAVKKASVKDGIEKPVFVKIAPDLKFKEIDEVIDLSIDLGISGVIATNTTNNEKVKAKYGRRWSNVPGGISGNDYEFREKSTKIISHIYKNCNSKLEIIGVGGVVDTNSALEKIKAGAKVLQIVTGLRGEGLGIANKINKGLLKFIASNNLRNISEIVGVDCTSVKEI